MADRQYHKQYIMLFNRLLKDPRPNNPRPPRRPSPPPAPPAPPAPPTSRESRDSCYSNSGSNSSNNNNNNSDNYSNNSNNNNTNAAPRLNTAYNITANDDDHNKSTDQREQGWRHIQDNNNNNNINGEKYRYRRMLISRTFLYFKTKLCNVICVPTSSTSL